MFSTLSGDPTVADPVVHRGLQSLWKTLCVVLIVSVTGRLLLVVLEGSDRYEESGRTHLTYYLGRKGLKVFSFSSDPYILSGVLHWDPRISWDSDGHGE